MLPGSPRGTSRHDYIIFVLRHLVSELAQTFRTRELTIHQKLSSQYNHAYHIPYQHRRARHVPYSPNKKLRRASTGTYAMRAMPEPFPRKVTEELRARFRASFVATAALSLRSSLSLTSPAARKRSAVRLNCGPQSSFCQASLACNMVETRHEYALVKCPQQLMKVI